MTVREVFPEGGLDAGQWHHLQELGKGLSPAQARWLSGYFAGLDAGLARQADGAHPAAPLADAADSRALTILYASETGNAAALARELAGSAQAQGLAAEIFDMADYKTRRLKEEKDLLIIASTHGDGDPPQPALDFFEYIEGRKAPRLEGLRFAVLALGDSTYEFYCEAGKRLDRRFEELGAARIAERIDCDVDYDEAATAWSIDLIARLSSEQSARVPAAVATAAAPAAGPAHDKRNPFAATILDSVRIVGRHSTKETRHIEIDLAGSGLAYEPGDAIGIVARNDPAAVAALIEAAGLDGDATVAIKDREAALAEALERDFEIGVTAPRFLDHWVALTGADALAALGGEERLAYLRDNHVIDIVRQFPASGLDAQSFVAGLRPLQPRLYSIASSLRASPDEAHVTLAPVRYELHGTARQGVASGFLADRAEPGAQVPVYIQANPHFRLPEDDAPIVMIGAGTGVAPYRAFLQEREVSGGGGKSWLFLGERNFRSDFLYQAEWQDYLKDGVLSRLEVAFSRDKSGTVYVQGRMREQAADLFAWLEEGAHLYVCGDAKQMAVDVHETLIGIVAAEGARSREAAEDYVRDLQRAHRYQRDVY